MLFTAPPLDEREVAVLDEIDELKKQLRYSLVEPRRWSGSLRKLSLARAIQGSNSIEGYEAELDDAAAIALGEEPLDAAEETRLALEGYRDAMTYVLQLAGDDFFSYSDQLVRSLHFMMTKHDLKAGRGLWRPGQIFVHDERTGTIVHEGPEADRVPGLMDELIGSLRGAPEDPPLIQAAMAHLNLVMIHPFRDGNGRMARCLQSLVLARSRILAPQFMSVEEYLGANTPAYYAVLAEVGGGSWQPARDVRPWIRFMLVAHRRQAATLLRRVRESEQLWLALEDLAGRRMLPPRSVNALFDAAIGLRIRNATYRAIFEEPGEAITDATASRDLKAMVDSGLLVPHGAKRGRFYSASPELVAVRGEVVGRRDARDDSDPFA